MYLITIKSTSIMSKQEIIAHLQTIINSFPITNEQKTATEQVVKILKKSNDRESLFKALDIIIKLLGLGSNFFDK